MPLYNFNISDDPQPVVIEMRDDNLAWQEVVMTCSGLVAEVAGTVPKDADLELTVRDDCGRHVGTIRIVASKKPLV